MSENDITRKIQAAWDNKRPWAKIDWLDLEQVIRSILSCETLSDSAKVVYVDEAVAAYTRRGRELEGRDNDPETPDRQYHQIACDAIYDR